MNTDYVNRTIILPVEHAPLARALAAHLAGPPGDGMWIVGISPDGAEPATEFVSSGAIGVEFDGVLTDADVLWGAVQASLGTGLKSMQGVTHRDCVTLVEAAIVVNLDEEPVFATFERIGRRLVEVSN